MAKKDKKPTIKNTKQRAGTILSSLLRNIAEEETEFHKDIDGNDRMVTKAEALARLVWKKALGYTEKTINTDGQELETVHYPDRVYASMLFDRLEGRVAAVESGKKEQRSVADRVGEQSKKRINALTKKVIDGK